VYDTLREEILDDALLAGQPGDAKDWMREVGCAALGEGREGSARLVIAGSEAAVSMMKRLAAGNFPVAPRQRAASSSCRRELKPRCMHAPSTRAHQMLDYTVPGGKLNRGMAVYDVLAAMKGSEVRRLRGFCRVGGRRLRLAQLALAVAAVAESGCCSRSSSKCAPQPRLAFPPLPFQMSSDEIFKANALGWCIELVRAELALRPIADCYSRAVARGVDTTRPPPTQPPKTYQPPAPPRSSKPSSWWRTTSWTAPSRGAGSRAGTKCPR
jgi:hypothetical protein